MDDPTGALTEMIRQPAVAASKLAPLRLFDTDELADVMRAAGLMDVSQTITAASQTVAATRPA